MKLTKREIRRRALQLIKEGGDKEEISSLYTAITGLPLYWVDLPEHLKTDLD